MKDKKIRFAIVDDHKLFREGIASLLRAYKDLSIIFSASNGIDFLSELSNKENEINIVLLDLEMPQMDGFAVLKKLKELKTGIKAIILTMHNEDELIYDLIKLGAKGLLSKNANIKEVVDAIRLVNNDELYFNEEVSKLLIQRIAKNEKVSSAIPDSSLSEREKEIIRLICNEFTIKEIADKLFISERTVDTHKRNIFEKTKTKNSAGIVMYAVRTGLV